MNKEYLKEYYDTVIKGSTKFEDLTDSDLKMIHNTLGFGGFQLRKSVDNFWSTLKSYLESKGIN
jgi:hypothetical protein